MVFCCNLISRFKTVFGWALDILKDARVIKYTFYMDRII